MNFNDDEKKQDISNVDESENEEETIKPIRNSIININYENNKLEKSFEIRERLNKNNIYKSERKHNKINILEKIKFSENLYTKNYDLDNNEENDFNYIHISSFKTHKKYFI